MPNTDLVRPSRDGDQFHYLWAARRCLSLLSSEKTLVAVSIEGSAPAELPTTSPELSGEELIDIAEYYGDESLNTATLVRYMQLKHSTRNVNDEWTASGLEHTISDFAKRYNELQAFLPIDQLSKKLEFWFVTNRPISADFKEAVSDAATGAAPRHPREHQKLERFAGLKDATLAAFYALLHLEDRQDNYWNQRNLLFQEMSSYLPDADVDAPTQLKELVTRKALTESEENPVIRKTDVLRAVKTDELRLFPAKNLIAHIFDAIPREQETSLIDSIISAENRPIIVHALAGVGKSVFSTRIAQGLPEGSLTIVYDCFGNGQYRSASGYRHHHKDALVQIANELAAKGFCHPLIPTPHADPSAYLRAFAYRLKQAATLLRLSQASSILCIVIDAADNAQMAAEELNQPRSFARDLLRETVPVGVRLVFLCRSHRQDLLDPPPNTLRLELRSFTRAETVTYLRHAFPSATEHDIDEFHRLSSQNPRVQALALSRKLSLAKTLRELGPNPTTVDRTLENSLDRLKEAASTASVLASRRCVRLFPFQFCHQYLTCPSPPFGASV